eukprot:TRINITY_DN16190_c0_g1_i2.p1 TRINITY_DN16190_c0_g1~~TRINITY_DN16190_c0_g1_i2.p1  ORF type:complete len:114 (+),score=18.88 TRINITY_DN16190_c0_g1_i2:49-342(+)
MLPKIIISVVILSLSGYSKGEGVPPPTPTYGILNREVNDSSISSSLHESLSADVIKYACEGGHPSKLLRSESSTGSHDVGLVSQVLSLLQNSRDFSP